VGLNRRMAHPCWGPGGGPRRPGRRHQLPRIMEALTFNIKNGFLGAWRVCARACAGAWHPSSISA